MPSLRANGSRECAPDDRLREAIQSFFGAGWIASSLAPRNDEERPRSGWVVQPSGEPAMEKRNATVAVIGAGDYIGAEIAKKFGAEGFTVFAGRRDGAKLEPLVREIEATGGSIVARALDARKEDETAAFLDDADKQAPLEVCIFNVGANVNFPILETTERVFRKVWEMACWAGFVAGRESARLMVPRGKG